MEVKNMSSTLSKSMFDSSRNEPAQVQCQSLLEWWKMKVQEGKRKRSMQAGK